MSQKKATWFASLGAGLEYYDFIIYGMLASYLSKLFFAHENPILNIFQTFSIFAMGYLARPVGGILFGIMGDRFGRKNTFFTVMIVMAFSTLGIGLLPTYFQIGSLAAIFLVFFRIAQGLSFGAELPGAITVVCEYANEKNRGKQCGFVISSTSIGACLASLVLYVLTTLFNQEEILAWAWRIPFLLGGLLAIASYWIRSRLQETPAYLQEKNITQTPFKELLQEYSKQITLGIGITALFSFLVIVNLYFPTYFKEYFNYNSSDIYLGMTIGLIWCSLITPVMGWVSDTIGRKMVLIISIAGFALASPFLFIMAYNGHLIPFFLCYQFIIATLSVCVFPMLVELFPTRVRFTGVATCYNLTYCIASLSPMLISMGIHYTNPMFLISYLFMIAIVTFISAWGVRKRIYSAF